MDYKWIKEWIDKCINTFKNKIEKNEIKEKFKNDTQNIIFSLNQYKNLLTWYITDEYEAKDYALSFLKENKENLKNAMILYRYNKNKEDLKNLSNDEYKKAKEILKDKWEEICEELVSEFFNKLEERFKKEQNICDIKWLGCKLDENRFNYDWFDFYPKIYEDDYVWPSVGIYFGKSKYSDFGLTFKMNYIEEDKNYEECLKCFLKINRKNSDNVYRNNEHYYCYEFNNFKNSKEEYAFIYWLIDNYDNWMIKIDDILKEFLSKKTIGDTFNEVNKILKS